MKKQTSGKNRLATNQCVFCLSPSWCWLKSSKAYWWYGRIHIHSFFAASVSTFLMQHSSTDSIMNASSLASRWLWTILDVSHSYTAHTFLRHGKLHDRKQNENKITFLQLDSEKLIAFIVYCWMRVLYSDIRWELRFACRECDGIQFRWFLFICLLAPFLCSFLLSPHSFLYIVVSFPFFLSLEAFLHFLSTLRVSL